MNYPHRRHVYHTRKERINTNVTCFDVIELQYYPLLPQIRGSRSGFS